MAIDPSDAQNSPFSINRKLLLIKAHYFVFNAGIAPSITFGSTIAKQIGYSAVTVGFIYTCLPLMGLVTKILFGAIADKFKLRKLIFFLGVLVCVLCSFIMSFVTTNSSLKISHVLCHDLSYINSCNDMIPRARIEDYMQIDPNSLIQCEVECQASTDFYQETRTSWHGYNENISENASPVTVEPLNHDHIRFFATLPKEHIRTEKSDCVYARINETRFKKTDPALIPLCKKDLNVSCTVNCDDTRFTSILGESRPLTHDFIKPDFWILFLIYSLNWCGMALTNSLSDTACFDILGNEPEKFGVQRMFGALGWGLITVSSGSLVDWFSGNSFDKDYRILFHLGYAILCVDLYIVYSLKVQHKVMSVSIFRDVRVLFYNFRTVIFTVWCTLTGILMGISWQFLYWHLEDISKPEDLKWSKTLQGLDSLFTTVIGELPFFLIAGKIIKLCGYIHTMTIILAACALRMFFYSKLPAPVWVLPVELISGFTFSMCYVLIASYSSLITIPGTESTVQGLFGAMFDGLGVSLGGLIGGIIYHKFGGSVLFGLLAIVSALAAVGHFFLQRRLKPTPIYNSQTTNTNGNLSAHYASPNDAITILERS